MARFDLQAVTKLRSPEAGGTPRAVLAEITLIIPIEIDGRPLTSISPLTLRRRVAMVFQVPFLCQGTVRDNLALARSLGRAQDGALEASPSVARALARRRLFTTAHQLREPA